MRVIRGYQHFLTGGRGSAAAIGNFDGIHLGHRSVIERARDHAQALDAPLGVITFEPHPREILQGGSAPSRLSPFRRKAELLKELGVDQIFVLPFSRQLMAMSAEAFIEDILCRNLGIAALVSGSNFRFGNKRRGDVGMLQQLGPKFGMQTSIVDPLNVDGHPCSSTRVRNALEEGHIEEANRLLGYDYEIIGMVRKGQQRGRDLGFPTANTYPIHPRTAMPKPGIYAVRAGICHGDRTIWHPAAASLGTNPTFGGVATRLEVHLLDGMNYDLYGRRLRVTFLRYLRDEARFDSVDALTHQMKIDCEQALDLFARATS